VYSIPAYALRFAAHCRSRLKLSELASTESNRVAVGAAKFWTRIATQPAHARQDVDCATLPLTQMPRS